MDFSITIICIAGIMAIFKKTASYYPDKKPYIYPLLGLFLIAVAGLIRYLPSQDAIKAILEFRWIVELWFMVLVLSHVQDWNKLYKFILGTLATSSAIVLVFYFTGFNPVLLMKPGHLPSESLAEPRLGGFFGHSMPFAHTYSMAFFIAAGFFLLNRKSLSRNWQIASGIGLLCTFLAIIFSYSRGIWLACIVAAVGALVISKNKSLLKALVAGAVLAGLAFAIVPDLQGRVTSTAQQKVNGDNQRKVLYRANWEIFKDHPIIGIGYGYNRIKLREYYDRLEIPAGFFEGHAHNQYVQWLSGTGILGLGFYMWFVLLVLFQNYQLFRDTASPPEKGILLGTLMAQICFLVASLTEANFSIAKNRGMYLFVIAIFFALKLQKKYSKAA